MRAVCWRSARFFPYALADARPVPEVARRAVGVRSIVAAGSRHTARLTAAFDTNPPQEGTGPSCLVGVALGEGRHSPMDVHVAGADAGVLIGIRISKEKAHMTAYTIEGVP